MMLIMRKSRYKLKRRTSYGKFDKILVLLVLIFLFGTIIGAVSFKFMDDRTVRYLSDTAMSYLNLRCEQDKNSIFLNIFIPNAVIAVLAILCGKISVFEPFVWVFPFFQGMGFGVFAVSMLNLEVKNAVKLFYFTVFQERFWPYIMSFLIFGYILKAGASIKGQHLRAKTTAEIVIALILIMISSVISTFIVFRFGISLIK